jgi:TetR/AcrR family transcriptional repressor of nem operon
MSKAANTRLTILNKAFDLVYKQGYQATSIDTILATTKVTKGAFFYHFKNKDDMGLAMINEVVYPGMYKILVEPLVSGAQSVDNIHDMMRNALLKVPFIRAKYGCPAMNLVDELSVINTDFKDALLQLITAWREAINACLHRAQHTGSIQKYVNTNQAAFFIVAGYSGVRTMGKALGTSCYAGYLHELKDYLAKL